MCVCVCVHQCVCVSLSARQFVTDPETGEPDICMWCIYYTHKHTDTLTHVFMYTYIGPSDRACRFPVESRTGLGQGGRGGGVCKGVSRLLVSKVNKVK